QGEQHGAYHASRKRQLTDIKGRDQRARYAEQCSRSTGADGQRIPQKSGETTDDSSEDVGGEVGEPTVECFRKSTEDDQRPHVSDEMSNTDMNEDVREKAPRLSAQSEGTEIPPHCTTWSEVGEVKETCFHSISRKTTMLMA